MLDLMVDCKDWIANNERVDIRPKHIYPAGRNGVLLKRMKCVAGMEAGARGDAASYGCGALFPRAFKPAVLFL